MSVILFSISFYIVFTYGKVNYLDINVSDLENVSFKCDEHIITCKGKIDNDNLHIDIFSKGSGKATVVTEGDRINDSTVEKVYSKRNVYVHKNGIITLYDFFGRCNGDISFIISFYIIIIFLLFHLIIKCVDNVKKNMYLYYNARLIGVILFVFFLTICHVTLFLYDLSNGFHKSVSFFIYTLSDDMFMFLLTVFPIACLLIILITISNIKLIKKEGKRWTNMLGIILGSFVVLSVTISVFFAGVFSNNIFVNSISYLFVVYISYLECIFVGTCVMGFIASRHIPKLDKDAIIILGCQIKKDGTLTPLLRSRLDRALDFGKIQKEKTGKSIIFVPSGGRGSDEIISEAEAMKNYMIQNGIKEKDILVEDKSKNTFENMKFSNKLIRNKIRNPNIAFSTTNYHVFRAGVIASGQNIDIEGIGSKTKSYYWINAFIREFVAILVSERKSHLKVLLYMIVMMFILMIIRIV